MHVVYNKITIIVATTVSDKFFKEFDKADLAEQHESDWKADIEGVIEHRDVNKVEAFNIEPVCKPIKTKEYPKQAPTQHVPEST
jgi:hypothetical protein